MANAVNAQLALPINTFFGNETDADCDVVFCKEDIPELHCTAELDREAERLSPPAKKQKTSTGHVVSAAHASSPATAGTYGTPLPAHRFVLRSTSDRFKAQFERWAEGAEPITDPSQPSTGPKPRPVLRVPLGSEAEVHSARAAIRFAYTGQVEVGSIQEALDVRRQGAYLQVEGCAAACDELIKARLKAGSGSLASTGAGGVPASSSSGAGGESSGLAAAAPETAAVLELYACEDQWFDATEDASFQSVLLVTKPQLLKHFGDTFATLNTPLLRQQLLALPAVAVEALLESDDFGTDCESSVLLLLATWMEVNHGKTDAATRQRLCRHVRLVQLTKPYLLQILPALALQHRLAPQASKGWFPIPCGVASKIAVMAIASAAELVRHDNLDSNLPWYNTTPRRQCLRPASRSYSWSISQEDLQQALDAGKSDCVHLANISFEGSSDFIAAGGFLWRPWLTYNHGKPAAGVFLMCTLPSALGLGVQPQDEDLAPAVATIEAVLAVHTWETNGGTGTEVRKSLSCKFTNTEAFVKVGRGSGWASMLPLRQSSAQQQGDTGATGGGNSSLAAWSDYLRKGKLTGILTLLPRALTKWW